MQYGILYDDGDREDFVSGRLILPAQLDRETCDLRNGPHVVVCGFAQSRLRKYDLALVPRNFTVGARIFARWT